MKKIGVLYGMENTFPGALADRINSMDLDGITAEMVHIGGVRWAAVADALGPVGVDRALDPARYLGVAEQLIDRALG